MHKRHRQQVDREARYWLTRMTSGSVAPRDRALFEAWKSQHPAHERAYAYLFALDTVAGECAATVADRSVVGARRTGAVVRKRKRSTSGIAWGALAAGLMIALVIGGFNSPIFRSDPGSVIYATRSGELREINLKDGSAVHLSGATRIEVNYGEARRDVRLIHGEALFTVAHSPERPFTVYTNNTAVRAVGTAFDVHKQPAGLSVAVIEGVVSVSRGVGDSGQNPGTTAVRPVVIEKGQKISYKKGGAEGVISYAPPEKFATWRNGVLEFDQMALETVIADINRYAVGRITIASDDIRTLPVTAVFAVGDFEEVAKVLPHILPVKVTVISPDKIVLSKRR